MVNKKKLLCICPTTKERKPRFEEMVESFKKHSSNYVSLEISYEIKPITQIYNEIFKEFPDYEFYSQLNDDFVYHTPCWDIFLSQKGKISYPNDLMNNGNLPVTSVIDGDIVRALGWLQLPTLIHLCGDLVWKYIGEKLGILSYDRDVIVEHKHYLRDRTLMDETYKKTNSRDMYLKDNQAYREWISSGQADKDIEAVRKVL